MTGNTPGVPLVSNIMAVNEICEYEEMFTLNKQQQYYATFGPSQRSTRIHYTQVHKLLIHLLFAHAIIVLPLAIYGSTHSNRKMDLTACSTITVNAIYTLQEVEGFTLRK